jgi:hypothetical protein
MNERTPNVEQLEKRIAAAQHEAKQWERRYKDSTISRALKDAAISQGAFNADQVVALLRDMTSLVEITDKATGQHSGQFKTVVDFPETDPKTGKAITMRRTPEEAVRRMKELPEAYGNLFTSSTAPQSATPTKPTTRTATKRQGLVDVRTLTPAQYREIRNTNPERLGLRPAYR